MPPRRQFIPSPGLIPPSPPADVPFIPPRQPGETAYAYRYRRTLAKYGQTPYQRRLWLGSQRGVSVSTARGYASRGGETESQRRNRISVETTGRTVSQNYRGKLRQWLEDNGYTPDNTKMNWTQLMRLAARLRYMKENGHWENGVPSWVTPEMIADAIDLEQSELLEPGWAFERLWAKYDAMVAYRAYADKVPGRTDWAEYTTVGVFLPTLTANWWFYH